MVLTDPSLQVVLALPDVTIPVGNVSVSAELRVVTVLLGFTRTIARVEAAPVSTAAGLKTL